MSDFYFFTELDKFQNASQSQTEAFGPLSPSSGKDRFHATNIHKMGSEALAVAVCEGIVLVQENNNGDLNIILKPLQQPIDLGLPYIKYFVYRGIKKSSLIDTSTDQVAAKSTNDLTKRIHETQEAVNKEESGSEEPPKEALGIDYGSATGAMDIEEEAFYPENVTYQLTKVDAGMTIGSFKSDKIGFEVITEELGEQEDFNFAREVDNVIKVDELPASPSQPELFSHWHEKEKILKFIDPAAFFGAFFNTELKTKPLDSNGNPQIKDSSNIYNDVISNFSNKNVVYLDIRNELNFSLNYFRNYNPGDIKLSLDGDVTSFDSTGNEVNYYISDWPVLRLNNFINGDSDKFFVKVGLPEADNPNPLLYLAKVATEKSFPGLPTSNNKLKNLIFETGDDYSNPITLATPKKNDSPVANFLMLKYIKEQPSEFIPKYSQNSFSRVEDIDHRFRPFALINYLNFNEGASSATIYHDDIYMNSLSKNGMSFISNVGVAEDSDGTFTFFTFPVEKNVSINKQKYPSPSISSAKFSSPIYLAGLSHKLNKNFIQRTLFFRDGTVINSYEIVNIEGSNQNGLTSSNAGDIIFIRITNAEFTQLEDIKEGSGYNFLQDYPFTLSFLSVDNGEDLYGNRFIKYEVVLNGFEMKSNNITKESVSTGIFKYRILNL